MASPTVQATNSNATSGTSHTGTLPVGVVAGDLLLAIFVSDGNPTHTIDTDYTEIFSAPAANNEARMSISYRQADASANDIPTHTTSVSQRGIFIMYRIDGHEDPSTQAPELSSSTGNTGTSTSPDPDSVTPTGGSKDYLFLAVTGNDGNVTTDTAPTNYANLISQTSAGGGGDRCNGGSAERQLTAASEDPGVFAISASDDWVAATIAIHPSAVDTSDVEAAARFYGPSIVSGVLGLPTLVAGFIPPSFDEEP